MGNRTITFNLPDGREDALIEEFAAANGWEAGNGTPAAWAKKVLAGVIRDSIRSARQRVLQEAINTVEEESIA